jgi:outer membrane protein OmpA-like peptidoglycan-associated protein
MQGGKRMRASSLLLAVFVFVLLSLSTIADAQLGDMMKKKVQKKAEKEVEKTIDDVLNEDERKAKEDTSITEGEESTESERLKVWSKYDFVPGDEIIFEDNLTGEQNGEFPSKWDLIKGNAENALLGDESVISFAQNQTEIAPLMKDEDYLPEVFTIEFDVYFYNKYNEAYMLNLKGLDRITIRTTKVSMGQFEGNPGVGSGETGWHHIAISFNKRALKAYYDQTRVLNIPNVKTKPTAFSISALSHGARKGDPALIKSIRIAEGGVKLYDRLQTEGEIVTRGILFDSGKAIIKPASMGVINEVVKLMNDHPELKFRIEGHTDSDGEEDFNQGLSERRAAAVKTGLVNLGIDESRLQTRGWGESKPVDDNTTPEGKANNRRVVFVKI